MSFTIEEQTCTVSHGDKSIAFTIKPNMVANFLYTKEENTMDISGVTSMHKNLFGMPDNYHLLGVELDEPDDRNLRIGTAPRDVPIIDTQHNVALLPWHTAISLLTEINEKEKITVTHNEYGGTAISC